jgi:hypothetical protein
MICGFGKFCDCWEYYENWEWYFLETPATLSGKLILRMFVLSYSQFSPPLEYAEKTGVNDGPPHHQWYLYSSVLWSRCHSTFSLGVRGNFGVKTAYDPCPHDPCPSRNSSQNSLTPGIRWLQGTPTIRKCRLHKQSFNVLNTPISTTAPTDAKTHVWPIYGIAQWLTNQRSLLGHPATWETPNVLDRLNVIRSCCLYEDLVATASSGGNIGSLIRSKFGRMLE